MRETIRDLISIARNTLPIRDPIYEFGSFQVPGQEQLADLRPLFPGLEFVGADMREGPGVDRVLELHDIALPSESAGSVLCLDTLEHVEYPHRALQEIHRILVSDGISIITSVMDFPIHDHPFDYWRFTPEAFRSILKPFSHSFVGFAGKESFPHTVVGVGFKGNCPPLCDFEKSYKEWQDQQSIQNALPTLKWIRKLLTPPLFSWKYRKVLGLTRRST